MQAVIANALRQRVLVIILGAVLMIGGLFAYRTLNIEAYPDPVPPLVDIITQNPGQSSEEIERYITVPIEIQMAGLPYVQAIRTISLFGLSDVKVQFTYDVSYQQASQMVINRLSQMSPLPNGVQPSLSPTSPIGEIFRYRVVGPPGYTVADLKTIQDWILQRRFKAVPGVYIVAARTIEPGQPPQYQPLFVGQTADLSAVLRGHSVRVSRLWWRCRSWRWR